MKTYVIAEAGVNHNGDIKLAEKLIDLAVEAEADAVKFQTFKSDKVISALADKADYQKQTTMINESQLDMVKKLELKFQDFIHLQNYCTTKGIEFLSTPFDLDSIDFLIKDLKLKKIKIPSGEITNAPYLLEIAKNKINIILSTGMANLGEIEAALGVIAFGLLDSKEQPSLKNFKDAYASKEGQEMLRKHVELLHCTTEYPAPKEEVNLNAIKTLKHAFGLSVGYSDHTQGIEIPVAAVALGATIIEKHLTFDNKASGPDHKASLEVEEMKKMIKNIRNIELALGSGVKATSYSERKNIEIARKSLVAKTLIKKGEVLTNENMDIKRPGDGVSPMYYWDIQGMISSKLTNIDERVEIK